MLEQAGSDSGVGRVRCGEFCCGDEPGVGLGADVGLVAVSALRAGLAGVAGLGVHCRYDPALREPRGALCATVPAPRGRPRRLGRPPPRAAPPPAPARRLAAEPSSASSTALGVADQIVDEPGPIIGVAPVAHRLGAAVVVVAQRHSGRLRRQLAHAPYLRADHRGGVLGRRPRHTAP